MARVEITFGTTGNRSAEGASMPVIKGDSMTTQVITSGASSQQSDASAAPDGFGFVTVSADAAIWIVIGANPTAVVPTPGQKLAGIRLRANEASSFAVANGHKVALINI